MENKNIFDKLIEKLSELEEGKYNDNKGISIDIVDEPKRGSIYAIIKKNNKEINISYDGIDKGFNIQIDENSCLYHNDKRSGNVYSFVSVNKDNKHYSVYEYGISCDSSPIFPIYGDVLFREIDNTCYLGYCFSDNKIYVYYNKENRRYNKPFNKNNCDGFVKFEYNDLFLVGLTYYNKKINDFLIDFKKVNTGLFKELAESMSISPLKSDFGFEIKELLETAKIYKTYKDKFDLKLYESELNEVYNYVVNLINEPVQSNINNIQNMIQNIDVTNK